MPRRRSSLLVPIVLVSAALVSARRAQAQDPVPVPVPAAFPAPRPQFQVAVGMGASIDHNEGQANPDAPVPSFFFAAGLGGGLIGLDVRSFANGAVMAQIARLSLELLGVVRPLIPVAKGRSDYGSRVLQSFSVAVGPAFERVSLGLQADGRFGASLGAHLDLPIGPAGASKEMRLRLGVRRMFAGAATVNEMPVKDTKVEVYAQLAFVF